MAITKLSITGNTTSVGISTTPVEIMLVKTTARGVPVTPNDNITATNVQAALEQLDDIKLQATNGTLTNPTISGSASFGDNDKANFGASDDLQIFHQSSNNNSIIRETGGGDLSIQTNGSRISFYDTTNSTNLAEFITGGGCSLRHNGSVKFLTTSTGIDVTGTVVADGLTVNSGTANQAATFESTDAIAIVGFEDNTTSNLIATGANGDNFVFYNDSERMRISDDGHVGIGTSSPTSKLTLTGTGGNTSGLSFNSSNEELKAYFTNDDANSDFLITYVGSTSPEIKLKHDGSIILCESAGNVGIGTNSPTETLDIDGDSIRLRQSQTPASATATGTQGQIAWDANYMYVCTATNTWKRVALATW